MSGKNEQDAYNFLKELALQVEEKQAKFEGVYIVSPENYQRFLEVYTYLRIFAEKNDGKVNYLDFSPEAIHADVSIDVPLIDLVGSELEEFVEALSKADVFGITPTTSGSLLIDVSVNYVWEAVPKK